MLSPTAQYVSVAEVSVLRGWGKYAGKSATPSSASARQAVMPDWKFS